MKRIVSTFLLLCFAASCDGGVVVRPKVLDGLVGMPRGGGIFSRAVDKAEQEVPKLSRKAKRAAAKLDEKAAEVEKGTKETVEKGKKKLEEAEKAAKLKAAEVEEEARSLWGKVSRRITGKAEEEAKTAAAAEAEKAGKPIWEKLTQVLGFPSSEED